MTNEEKTTLLRDLCARLPFNVVIRCCGRDCDYQCFLTTDILHELQGDYQYYDYKPYLRSVSTMTEIEIDQLFDILHINKNGNDDDWIKINDVTGIKLFLTSGRWVINC